MDALTALEDWVAPLLAQLQPGQRRRAALEIARELRRSQQRRIAAQANPDGSPFEARKPQRSRFREQRGALRRGAMFGKLRTAKHLKAQGSAAEASVGFVARTARIAEVHQLGLRDRVQPGGPEVHYPARALLGFTETDRELVRDVLLRILEL